MSKALDIITLIVAAAKAAAGIVKMFIKKKPGKNP